MDADFWKFVSDNANASPEALRLKYHGKDMPFDVSLAITQIECRKKFGVKLQQTLAAAPHWIFPSVLAGEQATSDRLAAYHASLVADCASVCDLTAGLGIDATHIAKHSAVTAVEMDAVKAEILDVNAREIGVSDFTVVNADCRDFVREAKGSYDAVFIDPARRSDDGGRVYNLSDCSPDVLTMLSDISRLSRRLMVKMSPMLDLTTVIDELGHVERIIALGTPTECRELVADVSFDRGDESALIEAVTLLRDGTQVCFSFTAMQEREAQCPIASVDSVRGYLYEPYPTVMKAGPYKLLAQRFGIAKLHANTHLYVSDEIRDGFPGDIWRIERVMPFESKHIKRLKRDYPQLMVTTRNFDFTPERLRAKLGVKDAGDRRLFAVTAADTKLMIIVCPVDKDD